MDTVSVSNAQSLLFNMSRQAETEAKEPNTGVEVVAVASTEAAAFAPPGFFISPVSVSDAPESSAQPSPADASQQELQLHPPPAPVQEQRTIFVAGFPLDMTEREFHCLLTFLPGYEACQLSWGTGAPQGFALFKCNLDAASAVERLAGHQVEVGAVLRAELAHKNLVIKVRWWEQPQCYTCFAFPAGPQLAQLLVCAQRSLLRQHNVLDPGMLAQWFAHILLGCL
jgi:hypothetical protein